MTISILINEPSEFEGGKFIALDENANDTMYDQNRGTGILFCSEKIHNVTTVEEGIRKCLVVELWDQHENVVDRDE